ncbi:VOC family protein [Pseudonocardia acidicola]|uniref:VOC family protein n=1 Tax=Pseudonocardia acidicola TaxID=2724939 RepID=A0ABX1SH36_9PSEU|nr:VOC family protein [Pseudonocardia acidicola]NMI00381.1 VOC family protein [Pseudonocardia acidicola]
MEMHSYPPGRPSWVDLGTPDPAAAAEFYGGLFGWAGEEGPPESGGYRMCLMNGYPVAGIGPMRHSGRPFWATYISVVDADTTAKSVRDAGGQVYLEPMDVMTWGRMAALSDPTGAAFAVWQPRDHIGAGLWGEPGACCWNELTTREPAAAAEFYHAVFGWTARTEPMGGFPYTVWLRGDQWIGGMLTMDEKWPADIPAHWMVYFAATDTDTAAARARELGGAVLVPPTDIQPGRFTVLGDPQGAVFSIITPPTG